MAARAYWKGYLRLSLVTIGIELNTAVNSGKDTALHQIHKPSGRRIKFEKVAPGIGAVNTRDIVKGIEIAPRYCERPYDVTSGADEVAAEGFAVIREALRKAKKVGLGQIATRAPAEMARCWRHCATQTRPRTATQSSTRSRRRSPRRKCSHSRAS